ncbi:MAG: acyltransferase family protein [Coriobacteriales bacterium]|nr:acyltransferase family protein [Coriobacteriales bacterium]
MPRRLHYIDWLRVLAVLLLFPFHTSRVFNYGEPFYVKSQHLSQALNYFIGFVNMWHMSLLFLLAGASTYFSLSKRTVAEYASERVTRLLVPLVFGIFVVIPPQTYVGARYNSGYTGSFVTYITSGAFLQWNIRDGGDYYGGFGIGQLWFIAFLLLMSLLALPFFAWARHRGSEWTAAASRRLARPAWWLLPPVVLYVAEGLPHIVEGKPFFFYLALFVLGFITIADDTFAAAAELFRWITLLIGAVLCLAYTFAAPWREALPDPSFELTGTNLLGMLGVWLVLLGLLGVGRRYLDAPSATLSYLAEGSYPVYILHQTAIVVLAYWIVLLPTGGIVQWVAVLVAAVTATFCIYEAIRRLRPLRFLFGMRVKTR